MNYKDLDIQRSYISMGPHNIADTFLNPTLKFTKVYKRSVGFFSSGVLQPILSGILSLARNRGTIELVASPKLTSDDMEAISAGYEARDKIINRAFERDFLAEINDFSDEKLQLLADLIANGILDIKIAVTDTIGDYHDKLGILEDFDGNVIAFYGSANSSINGYQNNYEKIRVVRGWMENECDSVSDEQKEFDSLWNGTNPFVQVYSFKESAQNCLLIALDQRSSAKKNTPIVLRDYQEEAIAAWVNNQYHGFYVMATGTGKTWTAIFSAKKLLEEHPAAIVICAPYKHLVRQWAEDVEKAFPQAKLVLVSSENPKWEQQLSQTIIKKKYEPETQLIVISTIASFKMKRFDEVIRKSAEEKMLIVDEAHRFTDRNEEIKQQYQYLLGLSATPYSGTSAQKGIELMQFFGGQVFSLPIEKALEKGYLVPYYYHPIYVHATENDEKAFQNQTKRIISCFKNNICINPDLLVKALRARLRVISMAEEKQEQLDWIISNKR